MSKTGYLLGSHGGTNLNPCIYKLVKELLFSRRLFSFPLSAVSRCHSTKFRLMSIELPTHVIFVPFRCSWAEVCPSQSLVPIHHRQRSPVFTVQSRTARAYHIDCSTRKVTCPHTPPVPSLLISLPSFLVRLLQLHNTTAQKRLIFINHGSCYSSGYVTSSDSNDRAQEYQNAQSTYPQ